MQRRTWVGRLVGLVLLVAAGPAIAGFEAGMPAYLAGDLEGAFRVWLPLAEAGDPMAQNQVGVMYGAGLGVDRDDAAAAGWFGKAMRQGHVGAQSNLARLYLLGLGVPRDPALAVYHYKRSALAGYTKAQAALGNLYARGEIVPKDLMRAYFWWTLAAEQGDFESAVGREDAAFNMTPQQIRTGNLLAERFRPLTGDAPEIIAE